MTTQGNVYEDFDGTTRRNVVLLRFSGEVVDDRPQTTPNISALTSEASAHAGLYKGGSDQWFVTYELGPESSHEDTCPQVTRVYLSGELRGWEIGTFRSRSGAPVYGMKIEYDRTHESYRQDHSEYETSARSFAKIIELPIGATEVELRSALPDRYRHALHRF